MRHMLAASMQELWHVCLNRQTMEHDMEMNHALIDKFAKVSGDEVSVF